MGINIFRLLYLSLTFDISLKLSLSKALNIFQLSPIRILCICYCPSIFFLFVFPIVCPIVSISVCMSCISISLIDLLSASLHILCIFPICLLACLLVCLLACLLVCLLSILSILLSIFPLFMFFHCDHLAAHLFIGCLCVCLSVCLSVYTHVYLPIYWPICLLNKTNFIL